MSLLKSHKLYWMLGIVAVLGLAAGSTLIAQGGSDCVTDRAGGECRAIPDELPIVPRGPQNSQQNGDALVQLFFDDGTCESGLGVSGAAITDLVDFDVPTQCVQAGLDIVGLTARVNTNTGTAFAFAQAGGTPPPAGAVPTVAITPIGGAGPCPATGFTNRAIGPGAATITGTANFYAGIRCPGCFSGRDTNGAPAGRIWLNCATCGMTQYSPAFLSGLGFGGNWMIRVTVEDANCVPVELMEFSIEDS